MRFTLIGKIWAYADRAVEGGITYILIGEPFLWATWLLQYGGGDRRACLKILVGVHMPISVLNIGALTFHVHVIRYFRDPSHFIPVLYSMHWFHVRKLPNTHIRPRSGS